jgi:hypothetical protein
MGGQLLWSSRGFHQQRRSASTIQNTLDDALAVRLGIRLDEVEQAGESGAQG